MGNVATVYSKFHHMNLEVIILFHSLFLLLSNHRLQVLGTGE